MVYGFYLTIVKAVILILKRATALLLSKGCKEALTKAGQDYQQANIDHQIQEYFKQFPSVQSFADFIMAINFGLSLFIHLLQCDSLSHLQPKQLHRDFLMETVSVTNFVEVYLGANS